MENLKLTIELVPRTAWYTNVRSNVSRQQWDHIRHKCYDQANHVCEVCGDVGTNQGVKHKVECHEIWMYDDVTHTQSLTGLIALCPNCHKVKHPGLAQVKGQLPVVVQQLMKVNGMTETDAVNYISEAFYVWKERSQFNWTCDTSYLDHYLTT